MAPPLLNVIEAVRVHIEGKREKGERRELGGACLSLAPSHWLKLAIKNRASDSWARDKIRVRVSRSVRLSDIRNHTFREWLIHICNWGPVPVKEWIEKDLVPSYWLKWVFVSIGVRASEAVIFPDTRKHTFKKYPIIMPQILMPHNWKYNGKIRTTTPDKARQFHINEIFVSVFYGVFEL